MFLCENPGDQFHTRLRFSNRKSSGAVNIALEAQAQNNSIQTTLNWGNSSTVTYSGTVAVAHFIREQKEANENKRKLPP